MGSNHQTRKLFQNSMMYEGPWLSNDSASPRARLVGFTQQQLVGWTRKIYCTALAELWPTKHFVASFLVARHWPWTTWQCPLCSWWWWWCQPLEQLSTLANCAKSLRRSEVKKISEPMCTKNVPGQFEDASFFSKDVLWSQHLLFSSKSWEAKLSSFEDLFFLHSFNSFLLLDVLVYWHFETNPKQKVSRAFWGKTRNNSIEQVHPSGIFACQKHAPTTCMRDAVFFWVFQETGTNQPTNERLNKEGAVARPPFLRWSLFSTHGLWQQARRSSRLDGTGVWSVDDFGLVVIACRHQGEL